QAFRHLHHRPRHVRADHDGVCRRGTKTQISAAAGVRRKGLVSVVLRASGRFRCRRASHPRREEGRRLDHQRSEDMDIGRALLRLWHPADPHRSERRQAQGPHHVLPGHEEPGRRSAADQAGERTLGFQRGLLHRREDPGFAAVRGRQRRLERLADDADERAHVDRRRRFHRLPGTVRVLQQPAAGRWSRDRGTQRALEAGELGREGERAEIHFHARDLGAVEGRSPGTGEFHRQARRRLDDPGSRDVRARPAGRRRRAERAGGRRGRRKVPVDAAARAGHPRRRRHRRDHAQHHCRTRAWPARRYPGRQGRAVQQDPDQGTRLGRFVGWASRSVAHRAKLKWWARFAQPTLRSTEESAMNFDDTPQEAEFRSLARKWIEANAPKKYEAELSKSSLGRIRLANEEIVDVGKAWQKKKAEGGWACLHWPREYGGRGATRIEKVIWQQEEGVYGKLTQPFQIGEGMCGPTVMAFGSEDAKRRYLPKLASGEEIWCQLFSEPSAGSDVAGLRTRAEKKGDNWIVNGQKIWTSGAHYSDYGLLIPRTDPNVPKHKGLTMFFLDMKSKGVEVRPIKQANGMQEFNEVYF